MLARYLEILITAQLFHAQGRSFPPGERGYYYASKTIGLIPLMHAITLFAVAETFAIVFHFPRLHSSPVRMAILAPFLALSAFVFFDTEYLEALKLKVRAYPEDFAARRRRQARAFVWASYIMGTLSMFFLGISQAVESGA